MGLPHEAPVPLYEVSIPAVSMHLRMITATVDSLKNWQSRRGDASKATPANHTAATEKEIGAVEHQPASPSDQAFWEVVASPDSIKGAL